MIETVSFREYRQVALFQKMATLHSMHTFLVHLDYLALFRFLHVLQSGFSYFNIDETETRKANHFHGHTEAKHCVSAVGKLNCFLNNFPLFKCTEAFLQNKLSCFKSFSISMHFVDIHVFRDRSHINALNLFENMICS